MSLTLKEFLTDHTADRSRKRDWRRVSASDSDGNRRSNGDLDNAKVGAIRNYLRAVGGELSLDYVVGDQRMQVA